jgi:hypothetical protein
MNNKEMEVKKLEEQIDEQEKTEVNIKLIREYCELIIEKMEECRKVTNDLDDRLIFFKNSIIDNIYNYEPYQVMDELVPGKNEIKDSFNEIEEFRTYLTKWSYFSETIGFLEDIMERKGLRNGEN